MKLTLKSCLDAAEKCGVTIYGDASFRGECKAEDADLAGFFAWARHEYPEYESLIFHAETEFNPQGNSSFAYHAKSKAKGRMDGIADIICLPISHGAPAFMCELKRLDISQSLAKKERKIHFNKQLLRLQSQKEHGAVVCVALGLDNAKQAFKDYEKRYGALKGNSDGDSPAAD